MIRSVLMKQFGGHNGRMISNRMGAMGGRHAFPVYR